MQNDKLPRRNVLAAAAIAGAFNIGGKAASAASLPKMNVVIFLTDQQRKTMHFPPGWEAQNLPGMTRLKRNGVSFEKAFTNACMCSPARATFVSGYFPAQHGVKYTLEPNLSGPHNPQVELPLPDKIKNIATAMSAAGYEVVYKGKFHLTKYKGSEFVPEDVGKYGFKRWNPQDAGGNTDIDEEGGGDYDNDGRFMYANGPMKSGQEGALAYLENVASRQQPFCLIISLVNPHDVLFYPKIFSGGQTGYTNRWLNGTIQPPGTVDEDLSSKPSAQRQFLALTNAGLGPLTDTTMQKNYLNFYGNLMRSSDSYLVQTLDALDRLRLTEKTLVIQSADHGEMGLTHGGQRQKNFNFYEEALTVPLIYSNPKLYPTAKRTEAMVSHVDFLPTLATLFNVPGWARSRWQGVDYSSLVLDPGAKPVQDYVVFTYDDYQSGQSGAHPLPPNRIVSLREQRYKLAQYYDVSGHLASEWEMYDLLTDPSETVNLAAPGYHRNAAQEAEYKRLQLKLKAIGGTRLRPLPT